MVPVAKRFDIVITTNSGYPLDLNLYQAVKGMSAASRIVRPGGSIIVAAECWDGIPEHGEYANLLRTAQSPFDDRPPLCPLKVGQALFQCRISQFGPRMNAAVASADLNQRALEFSAIRHRVEKAARFQTIARNQWILVR